MGIDSEEDGLVDVESEGVVVSFSTFSSCSGMFSAPVASPKLKASNLSIMRPRLVLNKSIAPVNARVFPSVSIRYPSSSLCMCPALIAF